MPRQSDAFPRPLRHVHRSELHSDTDPGGAMRRFEAISGSSVGSERIWMGQAHLPSGSRSADHHHGESETAIYVVSGSPEFVFLDPDTNAETRIHAQAGDYVLVPPFAPHREENNDEDCEAVVVLARSTQEAIVVNLTSLDA